MCAVPVSVRMVIMKFHQYDNGDALSMLSVLLYKYLIAQEAEEMHLKAIGIKEELLGPEDYEVGLSIGHLASLYNFHMNRYRDAEKLYYRSIAISKY